jgi:hypothetical protein
MTGKTIAGHGGGRDTSTEKRDFGGGADAPPGKKGPDPGLLKRPRQSGSGSKPPEGQEKARPRDTGRSGA